MEFQPLVKGKKVTVGFFYSATYAAMPRPAALYNRRKWQLIGKSQWCGSAMLQLQHTPPPQSTTPGLHPVSIHQTSPLVRGSKHPITAYYSIYRPRKDKRLSRPGWLVTYRNKVPPPGVEPGHVTHPSTNRARRSVTSLIRPTTLPLRHAATPTRVVLTRVLKIQDKAIAVLKNSKIAISIAVRALSTKFGIMT